MIVAFGFASCAKESDIPTAPLNHDHWHRVSGNPPTYYPAGVPADHPTGLSDGYWIMTGDTAGTRYFVPGRAKNGQQLIAEAMSQVTPEQRKAQDKRERLDMNMGKIVEGTAWGMTGLLLEADAHARRQGHDGLLATPDRR